MRALIVGLILVGVILGTIVWKWKRVQRAPAVGGVPTAVVDSTVAPVDTSTGWTPADTTQTGP